ncbi:MAG: HEPN domain-containing protein [Candidatus Andersenbacteria bacterium]|nr:HEPN domain-containing protein [Candidatus Andersenbacteria bacterium]
MTKPDQRDIAGELRGANEELEAAKLLLKNHLFAQAVSSAYYAVYHAARAALWSREKNAKTHRGIAQLFGEEFIRTGELEALYANILTGHRERREMADYDPVDFQISSVRAESVVTEAQQFVEKIKDLLGKV